MIAPAKLFRHRLRLPTAFCAVALGCLSPSAVLGSAGDVHPLVIDLAPTGDAPAFRPDEALGAAFDGGVEGQIDEQLAPGNIAAMKGAGLRPLTYRLRTELGIEAWHWNPVGQWSDAAHRQGYWISSDAPAAPILMSWGYRLPRRGDTVDNANNDDYSRLTDGDLQTFWKSSPYLDPAALHDGEKHLQWLLLRLDRARPVDAAVIDWAEPYATRYDVQYWTGQNEVDPAGRWATFPHGHVDAGQGGPVRLSLADRPVSVRYLRVLMLAASGTSPAGSADWRDRAGYAVREVSFGTLRADGTLDDAVVHAASHQRQTFTHVSSTDPWHRAQDRDRDLEQAGIDRVFASGLNSGLPVMMPVGLLFDTPENAEAELRYIARRRYPVRQIELGEEPDGQYGSPRDYAALYLQWARRLGGLIPGARFGGPSLQSAFTEVQMLPDMPGSWNRWFIDYLKRRDRLSDLGFVSFEYYPFDDICGDIHAKLLAQDHFLGNAMRRLDADGVPPGVPRILSEYGFSAFSGRAMSEMPSALLMADIAGRWLSLGGSAAYMFGYPPDVPINQHQPCAGYGNMMLFMADGKGQATTPMPSFHAARLLTRDWMVPGHGLHRMLKTRLDAVPGGEVAAYAVRRPDGRLATLIVNRSPDRSFRLSLVGRTRSGARLPLQGPAVVYRYGPAQYAWADDGAASHPSRSLPPVRTIVRKGAVVLNVPPDTIEVAVLSARSRR